jgi:hypothetical protein
MTSSKRRTGIFRELKLWAQERSRHTKRRNDQSVLGLNSSDFERLLNVARLVNKIADTRLPRLYFREFSGHREQTTGDSFVHSSGR